MKDQQLLFEFQAPEPSLSASRKVEVFTQKPALIPVHTEPIEEAPRYATPPISEDWIPWKPGDPKPVCKTVEWENTERDTGRCSPDILFWGDENPPVATSPVCKYRVVKW